MSKYKVVSIETNSNNLNQEYVTSWKDAPPLVLSQGLNILMYGEETDEFLIIEDFMDLSKLGLLVRGPAVKEYLEGSIQHHDISGVRAKRESEIMESWFFAVKDYKFAVISLLESVVPIRRFINEV